MLLKWIYIAFVSLIIGIIITINIKFYFTYPSSVSINKLFQKEEILKQLNYLERIIHYEYADIEMQELFPEGYVFMNALYGLSWCEVGILYKDNQNIYNNALNESYNSLKKLESNEAKRIFDKDCNPQYGIFYQSWTNYLRSKILVLTYQKEDTLLKKNYKNTCRLIANVLDSLSSPYPETYKGAAWPADVLPGLVSLKIHDELYPEEFSGVLAQWIFKARKTIDKKTGLFPFSIDPYTGFQIESARGSSQSLIIRLLAELDTSFALEQYKIFKSKFVDDIVGLTVIREYPFGIDNNGDIDSGPVIFGAGSSATITTIGTARACGDCKLANALERTVEITGIPNSSNNEKKYLFGQFAIADMFITWAKISPNYLVKPNKNNFSLNNYNSNKLLLISILVVSILLIPLFANKLYSKFHRI